MAANAPYWIQALSEPLRKLYDAGYRNALKYTGNYWHMGMSYGVQEWFAPIAYWSAELIILLDQQNDLIINLGSFAEMHAIATSADFTEEPPYGNPIALQEANASELKFNATSYQLADPTDSNRNNTAVKLKYKSIQLYKSISY